MIHYTAEEILNKLKMYIFLCMNHLHHIYHATYLECNPWLPFIHITFLLIWELKEVMNSTRKFMYIFLLESRDILISIETCYEIYKKKHECRYLCMRVSPCIYLWTYKSDYDDPLFIGYLFTQLRAHLIVTLRNSSELY